MARIEGHKVFADCPVHGIAIEGGFAHTMPNADGKSETFILCRLCADEGGRIYRADGQPSFVKQIMTNVRKITIVNRRAYGELPKPCGGACTSGKRSCDCKCGGRCHGMGRCLGGH